MSDHTQNRDKLDFIPDKNIEEALSVIWELSETQELNIGLTRDEVVRELSIKLNSDIFNQLLSFKLIENNQGTIRFTETGERLAKNIVRRQRLAERLLVDILERPKGEIDQDACEFEHIISPGVEESICILLGHPQECPHGSSIPAGKCCHRAEDTLSSIVISLDKLSTGESARVIYLLTREHPEMHRLMQFGIIPGAIIRVHQIYPTFVIQIGQTQLAMENNVAKNIFIRRVKE
jgi:DtxR family transcriptional regulator, Mn-dependent transcriptional regulator